MSENDITDAEKAVYATWQRLKIEDLSGRVRSIEAALSRMRDDHYDEITELRESIEKLRKKIRNPFDALYRMWKESEWRI